MTIRIFNLAALMFAILVVPAAAQKEKAKVYKTPQEVFDAFLVAVKKRDAATFVGCLAPEMMKDMLTQYVLRTLRTRRNAEESNDEKIATKNKPLFDALDKHGLTTKATKDIKFDSPEEREKASKTVQGMIKNPAGALTDILTADAKINPRSKEDEVKAKLTDVKIDGNKATGMVVVDFQGKEVKDPIEFVKVGEGWKINPQPKKSAPPVKDKKIEKKDKVEKK